jgi:cytoskeleton protein RodZ
MTESKATLGQRLKTEREKQGMSAQKAADELHLDGWVVDALEGGDYARIGPAVYAKGHLKRYAALLGLPAAEVLDAYDAHAVPQASGSQPAGLRLGTASSTGSEAPWAQMLGFAVVAVIVAGVVWWKPWHLLQKNGPGAMPPPNAADTTAARAAVAGTTVAATAVAGTVTSGAAVADPAADSDAAEDPHAAAGDEAPVEGPAAAAPRSATTSGAVTSSGVATIRGAAPISRAATSSSAALTARTAAAGVGHARLRLSFSADAWVDVHDATGQRLYAGNGRANSVKTLSGAAPLKVYLKSAGGVQLQINDRAVAIGRQFVSGDSARFEAGADGVLRRESRPPAVVPPPVVAPTVTVASPHG